MEIKTVRFGNPMTHRCPLCKLHYSERALAERCEEWCSAHDSCNYEVSRQSLEARKA